MPQSEFESIFTANHELHSGGEGVSVAGAKVALFVLMQAFLFGVLAYFWVRLGGLERCVGKKIGDGGGYLMIITNAC